MGPIRVHGFQLTLIPIKVWQAVERPMSLSRAPGIRLLLSSTSGEVSPRCSETGDRNSATLQTIPLGTHRISSRDNLIRLPMTYTNHASLKELPLMMVETHKSPPLLFSREKALSGSCRSAPREEFLRLTKLYFHSGPQLAHTFHPCFASDSVPEGPFSPSGAL